MTRAVLGFVLLVAGVAASPAVAQVSPEAGPLARLNALEGTWVARGTGFATTLTYTWLQPERVLGVTNVVTGADGRMLARYNGMYAWDAGRKEIVFLTTSGGGEVHTGRAWLEESVLWHEAEVSGGEITQYASAVRLSAESLEYFADYAAAKALPALLSAEPIRYSRQPR